MERHLLRLAAQEGLWWISQLLARRWKFQTKSPMERTEWWQHWVSIEKHDIRSLRVVFELGILLSRVTFAGQLAQRQGTLVDG